MPTTYAARPLRPIIASVVLALALSACRPTDSNTPPTVAPTSPAIQTWEYKTLEILNFVTGPFGFPDDCVQDTCFGEDTDSRTLEVLNRLGSEGWELVGVGHTPPDTGAILLFKRPIP